MSEETQPGPDERSVPSQRQAIAEEIDRHTVIAEAKILVKQLDVYLALIGEWAADGWETEDAGQ